MNVLKLLGILVFASFMFTSCGEKKEKKKEGFSYEKTEEVKPAVSETESDVENVVIVGDDQMKFDKSEIKVKSGKTVKLTLRHKGKMDVNVMGHNFVLLKQGVNVSQFALKAATARDNKYIPKESEGDIIAHTDIIGGGQTTTIEFDAPEAGVYDFICSFPGHYAMMKGKFIVE